MDVRRRVADHNARHVHLFADSRHRRIHTDVGSLQNHQLEGLSQFAVFVVEDAHHIGAHVVENRIGDPEFSRKIALASGDGFLGEFVLVVMRRNDLVARIEPLHFQRFGVAIEFDRPYDRCVAIVDGDRVLVVRLADRDVT